MNASQAVVGRLKNLVRAAGRPMVAKVRTRVEYFAHEATRPHFAEAWRELNALRGELGTLRQALERLNGRCDDLDGHVKWLYDEQRRLAPHIAALDARVAAHERETAERGELGQLEYAHEAAEEVRAEHARIRARLALVSKYEERLARVEERLAGPVNGS